MKNSNLLTFLSLAVLIFSGCQNTQTVNTTVNNNAANASTNATANKNAPVANNATTTTSTKPAGFPASNLKPESVSADKPIPAGELKNAFFANQAVWKGKSVAITGNYDSHTTSTVSSGKIIRIDIADQTGKKVAACQVAAEPTKDEVKERNNRTFKGTIKEAWFDQVLLKPCEFLK